MGRLIYVREVGHGTFTLLNIADNMCQDRETEPRFQSGPPAARGGYEGGYGARGGYQGGRGGYGGGMGGQGMGGGGAGKQIFISNVGACHLHTLKLTDHSCTATIPSGLARHEGSLPPSR